MYLAIEGVIGVGKTTLARLLQPEFEAKLLLEAFEENPFLSKFYADRNRYAFQTQTFFLLSRYHQQRDAFAKSGSNGNLIADYTFQKDALFARLNLNGDELDTYHLVHDALAERLTTPDLIVYLQAETDIAMRRIAMRDRPYERNMDRSYIESLNNVYEDYFNSSAAGKSLLIDTSPLDFVARPEHLDQIVIRIRSALGVPPYQTELPLDEMSA